MTFREIISFMTLRIISATVSSKPLLHLLRWRTHWLTLLIFGLTIPLSLYRIVRLPNLHRNTWFARLTRYTAACSPLFRSIRIFLVLFRLHLLLHLFLLLLKICNHLFGLALGNSTQLPFYDRLKVLIVIGKLFTSSCERWIALSSFLSWALAMLPIIPVIPLTTPVAPCMIAIGLPEDIPAKG